MNKLQEAFERWAARTFYDTSKTARGLLYVDNPTRDAWRGYQAAVNDMKASNGVAWGISISNELSDVYLHKQLTELEFDRRNKLYPDPTRKFVPLYRLPEDV